MSAGFFSPTALMVASFALSVLFTALVRVFLVKRALLDHPNERSSHAVPVPRGGGWAVALVLIPGMLATALFYDSLPVHAGLILGAILLVIVSWLDDFKGASPGFRLSMHILAACLGSFAFSAQETLFAEHLPFWLDRAVMIVGWAWFLNLYNFMDGIDGITGVETITIAMGACILFAATGISDPFASALILLLTGAALGFLVFNWHPAKIFLGDVGSVPLGFLTGYLLLMLAVKGYIIPALIVPLYYLADSGITITKRALRGEKVWQAHREHFYQRAAQAAGRHDRVVLLVLAANIALIIAAVTAVVRPLAGASLAALAVAILLGTMHKIASEKGS